MYLEECKDYREILLECFTADEELVNVHHIAAGKGIDGCVDSTLKNLEVFTHKNFRFYSIYTEEKDLFGFFGVEDIPDYGPHFTTFFIMPRFRNKHFIGEFWEMVAELIGTEFYSNLYIKNIKAQKFFERAGAKEVARSENIVFYKFNLLCEELK